MFRQLTSFCDRLVQRYLPDAFLFAILLTIFVFLLGTIFTDSTPLNMVDYWGQGFWDLLTFAMQMSLVVITGYVLANTPIVKKGLSNLSQFANTPSQAILLVTFVSSVACLINYGFGLVVGALFSIHVVKRVPTVDYRLLVASAYSGFILWHGGLSASIPLTIALKDHFLVDTIGSVAVTETIFSALNLFIIATLVLSLPLINWLIMRSSESVTRVDPKILDAQTTIKDEDTTKDPESMTPADRLEHSQTISYLIGVLGLAFIVYYFTQNGFDLNINMVNFIFLILGIILHQTPKRFLNSVTDAVKNAGGIIIQFPFYAGIMGMMVTSGLSEQMSMWFVSISNDVTFPIFTFISAGIVNFFVPSGGGQWAVQGPIMIPAAMDLGVDSVKTAMAIAWGDAWTNMIQPFWALPLLAIAGLKVKDIMGFCMIILLWSFIPISLALLIF
ncbi:short-chain fatty acid transporter [Tenuibacillus multivorans]|uniref:Short-chain fatty acids transporter n=1 Tax=Tenuibacillus multivorans TaxID=237069 RepID=A0A1H0CNB2_9BACI|nr:short-chain fatty acid transporter [Tenuibacillus multivorans]GEL76230.1 short-chain fatty acids transporter [Tenuibacillus multivorans]SDN59358.1 short-chain fatty acids transporter [Tenuibacillus multivorans]